MLRPYRELLATPGGLAFSSAGFVARMPISMIGLGIVLLVSARTGSYGLAGALSATFALVNAAGGPLLARLVDRLGQRRVSVPAIAVHTVGLVALLLLVEASAPAWTYFVATFVAAAFFPSIGSQVRARWNLLLGAGRRLQTAYSFEAVVDEFVFITGPPLVTLLATRVWDLSGLLTALALLIVGSTALFAQRATEPSPHPVEHHAGTSVVRATGMPVIIVVMLWLGVIFGAMEVTAVAFAEDRGQRSAAGLVLALYAFGSMVGGLLYGAVHWRVPLPRRFLLGATGMALMLVPLPWVTALGPIYPLALLAGFSIAPTMISGMGLIERIVPPARFNEGMAWAIAGLAVGLAVGSSTAGAVVDRVDSRWGFLVASLAGAAAVAACAAGMPRLRAGLRLATASADSEPRPVGTGQE